MNQTLLATTSRIGWHMLGIIKKHRPRDRSRKQSVLLYNCTLLFQTCFCTATSRTYIPMRQTVGLFYTSEFVENQWIKKTLINTSANLLHRMLLVLEQGNTRKKVLSCRERPRHPPLENNLQGIIYTLPKPESIIEQRERIDQREDPSEKNENFQLAP